MRSSRRQVRQTEPPTAERIASCCPHRKSMKYHYHHCPRCGGEVAMCPTDTVNWSEMCWRERLLCVALLPVALTIGYLAMIVIFLIVAIATPMIFIPFLYHRVRFYLFGIPIPYPPDWPPPTEATSDDPKPSDGRLI